MSDNQTEIARTDSILVDLVQGEAGSQNAPQSAESESIGLDCWPCCVIYNYSYNESANNSSHDNLSGGGGHTDEMPDCCTVWLLCLGTHPPAGGRS